MSQWGDVVCLWNGGSVVGGTVSCGNENDVVLFYVLDNLGKLASALPYKRS